MDLLNDFEIEMVSGGIVDDIVGRQPPNGGGNSGGSGNSQLWPFYCFGCAS